MKITLSWDNMHKLAKEQLCLNAGLRATMANYDWGELKGYEQAYIVEDLEERSKNTCTVTA